MSRTQLEMVANLLVVLYLVTHGVSVPAEERGHLVSGFYLSARVWVAGKIDTLVNLLDLTGQVADA